MDLSKLKSPVQNFFFQNELWQRPGPRRMRSSRGCGERGRPLGVEAAFPGTLPSPPPAPRTAQDVESLEKPDGSCPEKEGFGHPSHPRPGTAAPSPEPVGVAAARPLTESSVGAVRWGRGLQRLRLGAATASRPATRPQGHRPARGLEPRGGGGGLTSHGEEKRLRSNWTGGGDGGDGPGSGWVARARLCQRRTRLSLAPDPAWVVRSFLIGGSETSAGLAQMKGVPWPAWARPYAPRMSLACRPGAQARVSVSHGLTDRQGSGPHRGPILGETGPWEHRPPVHQHLPFLHSHT